MNQFILRLFVLVFLLLNLNAFSNAQSVLLKSQSGKVKRKLHREDVVYLKMKESKPVIFFSSQIDSVLKTDLTQRKNNSTLLNPVHFPESFRVTNLNGYIEEIHDDYISIIPLSFDSLKTNDIREWSKTNYVLNMNPESGYQNIRFEDIHMMYISPEWGKAASSILSIAGFAFIIASPVIALTEDMTIDYQRLLAFAGGGLTVAITGTIWRKLLVKNSGYYSTNPKDKELISKRYKIVTLESNGVYLNSEEKE